MTTETSIVAPETPIVPRVMWADKITASWQKSLASILETGHNLIEAKDELEHGEWLQMVKNELPFGEDTAERLMKIARSPVLSNSAHGRSLPASWRTLYELARLPEDLLEQKIEAGEVTPRTERKDVTVMRGEARKASGATRSGVVKSSKIEPQLTRETSRALEEATEWIKENADEDDKSVAEIISWFEQFESPQLIAMLRTGSAEEAAKRPIVDVLRHIKAQYGAAKVDVAWSKIVHEDADMVISHDGSPVKRKTEKTTKTTKTTKKPTTKKPAIKEPATKKPITKKPTKQPTTPTIEKVAEDTETRVATETE
jgi:hypothetical protein